MWLEMSRDEEHGGEGWSFTECLWSPTHKKPKGRWAFYESLSKIRRGDLVMHLRGIRHAAQFVGFSIAASDGYKTIERPKILKEWGYAESFYRVDLSGFCLFQDPINLYSVFEQRAATLRDYFMANKSRSDHEHLFYVIQSNRLQCLNGAYLSDFSSELAKIVLGPAFSGTAESNSPYTAVSAKTGQQIAQILTRLGQNRFSENVRRNYSCKCCFPGCVIAEDRLLVGAHIARWSDAEPLRGETSNGLCLCLLHDRAFELGMFTLAKDYSVWVNPEKSSESFWAKEALIPCHGQRIKPGHIEPSIIALAHHWARVGLSFT